jgi:septal ring factor EnvC (AmiA/AmiB activator)
VLSQTADAQTRTAAQAERDRRAETARAEQLRAQSDAARAEIAELDARLVASAQRRGEAEAAATAAEARLAELRGQISADETARRRAQRAFQSALIAATLASRRGDRAAVRAGILARAAAPSFAQTERRNRAALAGNRELEAALIEEQHVLVDAYAAIDAERAELVTLTARRRVAQAALQRDAAQAERRARQLAAEARTLRELAERATAQARRQAGAGAAGAAIPAAWLAPAEGQIARGFGVREAGAPATQGATVRTRRGAQVISPASAVVSYAGPFRSYGQVLILNLDGGYAVVLTGLESVRVNVGDTVRAGEPLGEMPDSDTTAPDLYVEVRRQGQPVDPGRWLNARGLVAQGSVRAG